MVKWQSVDKFSSSSFITALVTIAIITIFVSMIHMTVKEIKNAPEYIVELYKQAGIFKNMREVHRGAQGAAEWFSHFLSVLKNSQVHEEKFFISFIKC